jgi:nucleoid-associated protein YgaU
MSGDFSEYPLWIAHYTEKPRPRLPKGWKRWTLWQYTDQGRVSGIGGRCDLDRFRGSLAELRAFAGGGTLPPPDFPPLSGPGEKTYSVQPGDTLSGIALRFGVTVSALVQVNHLEDPHLIFVGQVLHLATG